MRIFKLKIAALFLGVITMGTPAQAAGCEGIRDALTYNECLSKQAPAAARRVARGQRADDPEASVPARRKAREARGGRGVAISGQGRRVRAVIDPWAGTRNPAPKARRR